MSTYATENVKQVFNVRKGIDQLMNYSGKRVLQRVVVNRGEVEIHRYVTQVIVVEFLQRALLDMLEVFLDVVGIQLGLLGNITHQSCIPPITPLPCGRTPRDSHSDSLDTR